MSDIFTKEQEHIRTKFEKIYGVEIPTDEHKKLIREAVKMAFFSGYHACEADIMKIYSEEP